MSRIFKFHYNLTRIAGNLHEYQCTFMVISCSVLLRMRNVPGKSCRENYNTHFMFNNALSEHGAVHGIMWKNTVQAARQATDENRAHAL